MKIHRMWVIGSCENLVAVLAYSGESSSPLELIMQTRQVLDATLNDGEIKER